MAKIDQQIRACRNELLIHKGIKKACQKLLTKVYSQDDPLSFKSDQKIRNALTSLNHTPGIGVDAFFSARNRLLRDKYIQNLKKVLKQAIEKKGKISPDLVLNGFMASDSTKETLKRYASYLDDWSAPKLSCIRQHPEPDRDLEYCKSNSDSWEICHLYTRDRRYTKDGTRCWVTGKFIEDYNNNFKFSNICSGGSNSEIKCNDNNSDVWNILAMAAQMTFGKMINVSRGRRHERYGGINFTYGGDSRSLPYFTIVISNDDQPEFAINFAVHTLANYVLTGSDNEL